jgi:uncharacterized protein (TIGR03083 family)
MIMEEVAEAYAGSRARIAELAGALDGQGAATPVPACPGWSVHDVVAYVSGVVDDALAGRLEGVATDPWTAAQVEARRDRSVADILAEWEEQAPAFEGLLDAIGDPGRQAVADVATHEHDVRGALGAPGARDSDAVRIGLAFFAPRMVEIAAEQGIVLRVQAGDGLAWGPDDAPTAVTAGPFDLFRALSGRRSAAQLLALRWSGDAEAALGAFTYGPFRPAEQPLAE